MSADETMRCGRCGALIYDVEDGIRTCGHFDSDETCLRHLGEGCDCRFCEDERDAKELAREC